MFIQNLQYKLHKLNTAQIITLSFAGVIFVGGLILSPVLACFCYKTAKKPEIIVAYLPVYDKMKIGYTYYYVCSFHKDDLFNRRII